MRTIHSFFTVAGGALFVMLFANCGGSFSGPPPVTAAMVGAARRQQVEETTLIAGRKVFVNRCIECHVLPVPAEHSAAAWPAIVRRMSARASLSAQERDALLSYILAARNP